jgi:hypothetical protein
MLRRGFVRGVVSAIFAPKFLLSQQTAKPALPPPAPVPWTLGLNPKTPLPQTEAADGIAQTEQRFFTAMQMATLIRLCNVLLPPLGSKAGAIEAETPQFLDFLIGSSPAGRQRIYTNGLNWLDSESQAKYKKPFAALDDPETASLLKPWLRTWMNDHPPTEPNANFVNIAHDDIRTATLNSKAWSGSVSDAAQDSDSLGLYWYPIEPDLRAASADCARIPPHVMAAPKASHTIPSYPR